MLRLAEQTPRPKKTVEPKRRCASVASIMRKVVIHAPGSHEKLSLEEHPDPRPAKGEVLVDVEAIGVNYADCIVRMGLYESAKKYVGWPITPGFEVAGKVAALGEGAMGPAPGTPVLAVTRFGGYASRVSVPEHQVFPIPKGFSAATRRVFPRYRSRPTTRSSSSCACARA